MPIALNKKKHNLSMGYHIRETVHDPIRVANVNLVLTNEVSKLTTEAKRSFETSWFFETEETVNFMGESSDSRR
jgi:hypothetical protein